MVVTKAELVKFWQYGIQDGETQQLAQRIRTEGFADDVSPEAATAMRAWLSTGIGDEAAKYARLAIELLGVKNPIELFMAPPEAVKTGTDQPYAWLDGNGGYITYEPCFDERHRYTPVYIRP